MKKKVGRPKEGPFGNKNCLFCKKSCVCTDRRQITRKKFCSISCAQKWKIANDEEFKKKFRRKYNQKVKLVCNYCSKEFFRYPAHLKRKKNNPNGKYFCSVNCATIGRDKSKLYRYGKDSPRWNGSDYRRIAIEKYGATCQLCGYSKCVRLVQVHHKDHDRSNNSLDNLLVLCIRCHYEIHLEEDHAFSFREPA